MHDDRHEDTILSLISPGYDFVPTKYHKYHKFGVENIRTAMCNAFNDRNSGMSTALDVAGPGGAMQTAMSGVQSATFAKGLDTTNMDVRTKSKVEHDRIIRDREVENQTGRKEATKHPRCARTIGQRPRVMLNARSLKKKAAGSGRANMAKDRTPGPFFPPSTAATTADGSSSTIVGGSQQPVPTPSAPPVFHLGTPTPPQHAGLSEDTFDLFGTFGGEGGSAFMAAAPTSGTDNKND